MARAWKDWFLEDICAFVAVRCGSSWQSQIGESNGLKEKLKTHVNFVKSDY